jgi:hypothetical protein
MGITLMMLILPVLCSTSLLFQILAFIGLWQSLLSLGAPAAGEATPTRGRGMCH